MSLMVLYFWWKCFLFSQAGDKHYHPSCARCSRCNQMFTEGEEMYLQGEQKFLKMHSCRKVYFLLSAYLDMATFLFILENDRCWFKNYHSFWLYFTYTCINVECIHVLSYFTCTFYVFVITARQLWLFQMTSVVHMYEQPCVIYIQCKFFYASLRRINSLASWL